MGGAGGAGPSRADEADSGSTVTVPAGSAPSLCVCAASKCAVHSSVAWASPPSGMTLYWGGVQVGVRAPCAVRAPAALGQRVQVPCAPSGQLGWMRPERFRQGGSVGADGSPVGRRGGLRPVWGEGVGDAPFVRTDEVSPGELGDDGLEEKPIDLGGRQGGLDRAADEAFPVEGRDGGDEVEGVPVWGPEVSGP